MKTGDEGDPSTNMKKQMLDDMDPNNDRAVKT
jgi:hypothetical protein